MMKTFLFIIGYLFYPISFLFPRDKKIWAFGSFGGLFVDNTKYLFLATTEYADIKSIWISKNKQTVEKIKQTGLEAYTIYSIKGLWFALRAKYWFVNSYSSDILFFASGNAVIVNLWHGVGIKKCEFSIRHGVLSKRFVDKTFKERFYHPEAFRRPDFFVSSTDFQSVKFAEAFRIDIRKCLNIGYPRNRILLISDEERKRIISKFDSECLQLIETINEYETTYIYMPTWRDSQREIFTQNIDLEKLSKTLSNQNALLLLKPHPNTIIDRRTINKYFNIKLIEKTVDVYPILPYTDVLITDYSSILYDYLLIKNKSIILYIYDYEEYIDNRELSYPFFDNVEGTIVKNFEQLNRCIETKSFSINNENRNRLVNRFWGDTCNSDSSNAIIDFIRKQ